MPMPCWPTGVAATGDLALSFWRGCPDGLDGVGRSAEFVCSHMSHRRRLGRGVCGVPGGSGQLSSRSVGMAGGCTRLGHRNLPSRPGASHFNGSTRPVVFGLYCLEEGQHMLGAIGRP